MRLSSSKGRLGVGRGVSTLKCIHEHGLSQIELL
jgi:hypothetical protein